MKLPFPRSFKAWLVASVSLVAVTVMAIAPMIPSRAQSSTTYTFTDLGTLGGTYSKASSINNCGQIVGESTLTGGIPSNPTHPFIWRDSNSNLVSESGEMKDLGTLGGVRGLAMDINASGLVVGFSTIATGEQRAFRWFDLDGDGVPDPGEMNDLGVLPGYSTHGASGVNDNGQIVGSAENVNGASGFIWNVNTGLQLLPTLNGIPPSHGNAINNSSHIAGYASNLDHAFVFDGTTNIDLQTFGGLKSIAYDINAAGHAVGFAHVDNSSASPPSHAFRWIGTFPLQDLGVLTGGVRSQANSINSSGIVVGFSEVTGGVVHAFVHDGTQMYDLNALVTNLPAGWTLTEARGINDGGQIVGEACTTNDCSDTGTGQKRAFLLTPATFTPSCSPTVTVSVSPSSVSEDGATNLTYTFTRAPVTSDPLTVNFSATGTADSSDYGISASGSVTILANQQSATVVVNPTTDSTVEPNETVVLTTTAGTGYIVGTPTSATGTINNDDSTLSVSVSVSPSAAAEDGATNLVYTFTRSSTAGSLTVNFFVGGTADASTDYGQTGAASFTPPTGTVTFANGSDTATVTVNPTTDATVESDETVILTITTGSGYTVGSPGSATGTIANDDTDVIVTLSPLSVTESGAPNLVYTFTRTGVTTGALTVNFAVAGTATFNTDYSQSGAATFSSSAGTVTLSAGSSFATVTLDPTPDSLLEGDESVTLTVTSGIGYNVGSPSSTQGTITPDAPIVFTEEGNGTFAVAVDSVTFVSGPFKLTNDTNFSSDRLTRVILVTSNLGMTQADLATGILTVNVAGYANPLPIENVGTITGVPGLNASYIIVRLPADLPHPLPGPNNLTLTVNMGSATSNATLLSITP